MYTIDQLLRKITFETQSSSNIICLTTCVYSHGNIVVYHSLTSFLVFSLQRMDVTLLLEWPVKYCTFNNNLISCNLKQFFLYLAHVI